MDNKKDQGVKKDSIADTLNIAITARNKGVEWVLSNINDEGKPVGAEEKIGWSRVAWALVCSGEVDTASRVVSWAENSGQFNKAGDFSDLSTKEKTTFGKVYLLAHHAHGTWLSGAFSISKRTMKVLGGLQDQFGGFRLSPQDDIPFTDLLSTAQVGYTAILTGENEIANAAYKWINMMVDQQPDFDKNILYTQCIGDKLLTDVPKGMEFLGIVEFDKPKQAYYNCGIAAAFLCAYAQSNDIDAPIELAEKLLLLNAKGTSQQFEDKSSVQICKYGWGIAELMQAKPEKKELWQNDLIKMANWFVDMQQDNGAWTQSTFMVPESTEADKLIKTAEHIMELNMIIGALGRII